MLAPEGPGELPVLILVRHGESTANAEGRLLGRLDASLTPKGLAQARALAPLVLGATRLVSSPLGRAVETARALGTGLPVEVDERWVEVDYGELDGTVLADIPLEVWVRWRSDPEFRPPGGESLTEAGTRVREACEELFAVEGAGARAAGHVVVVSHVSPIKAATCWALGLGDAGAWRLYLSTGSATRIRWGTDAPVLERFNESPALGPVG